MTWMDEARAVIQLYHKSVPDDVSFQDRKRALRKLCPGHFRSTSWGRKVWPKACAEYLAPYGPKQAAAVPADHLSPLERLMQKAAQ